jgi:hypothetical protein
MDNFFTEANCQKLYGVVALHFNVYFQITDLQNILISENDEFILSPLNIPSQGLGPHRRR